MQLIDEVKERLSIFKNFYDIIRIVDPLKKKTNIIIDNRLQESNEACYVLWKKGKFCENCISMRAFINNDTYIKIEYDKEKIILVIATPVEINGNVFVAEILKDITQNGSVLHKLTEGSNLVEELISSMNEKVIKDDLTGLYNRRYINERLPIDINYNKISKLPLSVIMADIDFFKRVNDMYGHIIGDKILIDFSNLMTKLLRSNTDWVGRLGGEEFIIVLNDTELKNAYTVAEKIRKQLEDTTFTYDGISINITASFGVYSVTDYDIEISELISKVDKELYDAKRKGRNIVIMSQGDEKKIEVIDKYDHLSKLEDKINELRDTLNEICCTLDAGEKNPERLFISQSLDKLIVEYMNEMNKLK